MVSREAVKFRAAKMAIATGQMPNVELIWSVQKSEGLKICFGQGINCTNGKCRWRRECLRLELFADLPLASLMNMKDRPQKVPTEPITTPTKDCFIVEREPVSAGAFGSAEFGSVGS